MKWKSVKMDYHKNLFYSYKGGYLEDNLTRALVFILDNDRDFAYAFLNFIAEKACLPKLDYANSEDIEYYLQENGLNEKLEAKYLLLLAISPIASEYESIINYDEIINHKEGFSQIIKQIKRLLERKDDNDFEEAIRSIGGSNKYLILKDKFNKELFKKTMLPLLDNTERESRADAIFYKPNDFVIIFENKIYGKQHKGQLFRHKKRFLEKLGEKDIKFKQLLISWQEAYDFISAYKNIDVLVNNLIQYIQLLGLTDTFTTYDFDIANDENLETLNRKRYFILDKLAEKTKTNNMVAQYSNTVFKLNKEDQDRGFNVYIDVGDSQGGIELRFVFPQNPNLAKRLFAQIDKVSNIINNSFTNYEKVLTLRCFHYPRNYYVSIKRTADTANIILYYKKYALLMNNDFKPSDIESLRTDMSENSTYKKYNNSSIENIDQTYKGYRSGKYKKKPSVIVFLEVVLKRYIEKDLIGKKIDVIVDEIINTLQDKDFYASYQGLKGLL